MSSNSEISVDINSIKISMSDAEKSKEQRLIDRFSDFLNKGRGADVSFIVENGKEVILAHKQLLIFGSHVFEKIFNENPATKSIKILDAEAKHIKLFLRFIYLLEFKSILPTATDILPLKSLAEKFYIFELVNLCDLGMKEKNFLTLENSLEIYAQAQKYKNTTLEKNALNFICNNASKIVTLDSFLNVDQKVLQEVLSNNDLRVVNEIQLFNSIIKWAKAECERKKMLITPKYMRSVMENIIPLIRFPVMDAQDFSINVATSSILTTEELVSILLYFNICASKKSVIPAGIFNSKPRKYYVPETQFAFKPISLISTEFRRYKGAIVSDTKLHKMRFQVNKMIWIKSIGLNVFRDEDCGWNSEKLCAKIYLEDKEEGKTLSKRKIEIELKYDSDDSNFLYLSFENPVFIKPNTIYETSFKFLSTEIFYTEFQALKKGKNEGARIKKFQITDEQNLKTDFEISYDSFGDNSIGEIIFLV